MTSKMTKEDSKFISVFEPTVTLKDKVSVLKSLNKKDISGSSSTIQEFEDIISRQFDRKYAVSVSNGSVALDLALNVFNFDKNDEIIVPSFTIISCLSAIIRSGGKPIFCDVDINSWNMTLNNVKKVFNKNTKAILMVHTYGLTSEASEIRQFSNDNGLILIEDTAEAHGQTYNNIKCGSFGDVSTLSFYANKHITTGEGGMVLTDDEEIYKSLIQMRNLDFKSKTRFQHDNLYWNYRLGGLQAALGISQSKNLKRVIENKIRQGYIYDEFLSEVNQIILPLKNTNTSKNHYWVYGIVLKEKNRDELQNYLLHNGIQTRKFFWPLHLQNALPSEFKTNETLSISENLGSNGLYLPIGDHLNKKDQEFIANKIKSFFIE